MKFKFANITIFQTKRASWKLIYVWTTVLYELKLIYFIVYVKSHFTNLFPSISKWRLDRENTLCASYIFIYSNQFTPYTFFEDLLAMMIRSYSHSFESRVLTINNTKIQTIIKTIWMINGTERYGTTTSFQVKRVENRTSEKNFFQHV